MNSEAEYLVYNYSEYIKSICDFNIETKQLNRVAKSIALLTAQYALNSHLELMRQIECAEPMGETYLIGLLQSKILDQRLLIDDLLHIL